MTNHREGNPLRRQYYVLTDTGIDFGDTYINSWITSKERIEEIARSAQKLYERNQFAEFNDFIRDPGGFDYNDPMTDEVLKILDDIIITNKGETIYELREWHRYDQDEKDGVIQEWKENGVDADLLAIYVAYVTAKHNALKKFRQWQQVPVWVPIKHGTSNVHGESVYLPLFPEYAGKEYDELLELCLGRIYRYVEIYGPQYMIESVHYSLPAWDESLLPNDSFADIMQNHTQARQAEYAKQLRFGTYGLSTNFFPADMPECQIKKAIQAAYKCAGKDSKRQMPTTWDDLSYYGASKHGVALFQGNAKDLTIRFWFDFNEWEIRTAYPFQTNRNPSKKGGRYGYLHFLKLPRHSGVLL